MAQDQYQTVKEVADRLTVAKATVKGWRIANADLNEFLRRHQTAPRQHGDGPSTFVAKGKP